MTIEEMIRRAGWYNGDGSKWDALPIQQRHDLAFASTGCEIAYPTWESPVECLHTDCQIRRGEIPSICKTNRILRNEIERGWLRFDKESAAGRKRLAHLCRAIRRRAMETGIFDPWKLPGGWQTMVGNAINTIIS